MIIKDVLYKKGFSRPYLRYLSHEKADYVMREIHEGICGNHSGAQSLVHKIVQAGYYWPTMLKEHKLTSRPATNVKGSVILSSKLQRS